MKHYPKYIDHTQLKVDATQQQIVQLCTEALQYQFESVCVHSSWVTLCHEQLKQNVKVCTVIGFPLGAMSTKAKAFETTCALEDGASEFDMVMNIGRFKSKDYDYVLNDIKAVVKAAQGHCVKVIIETCLLSDEEIIKACELCMEGDATFVKTSTGFNSEGANLHVVQVMKTTVGDRILIKAAGGVRSIQDMDAMIEAGASRIGTSSAIAILANQEDSSTTY